jgi:hypothetical protein
MMQLLTSAVAISLCITAAVQNVVSSTPACPGCSIALDNIKRMNWQVYDADDMNERLRTYNGTTESVDIPVHCNLSLSLGQLSADNVLALEDNLKVMMYAVLQTFNRDAESKRNWNSVMSTLKNNPLIEEIPDANVHRDVGYENDEKSGRNRQPNDHPFSNWFETNLISDNNVIEDTAFDMDALEKIIAQPGTTNVEPATPPRNHYARKQLVDISILRFPDLDNPFIQVYRLQLAAWNSITYRMKSRQIRQIIRNGVDGVFDSTKFRPRESVLRSIAAHVIAGAVAEIDDLFA